MSASRRSGQRDRLASGEKLEAGIFVSYGAPRGGHVRDHIFGPIKVSIAERSTRARGNGSERRGARAHRGGAAAEARAARPPDSSVPCTCRFLPATLHERARGGRHGRAQQACWGGPARGGGDPRRGGCASSSPASATQGVDDDRGDIYNGGAAVSEDALKRTWKRAARAAFLRRDVQVEHPRRRCGEVRVSHQRAAPW